MSKAYVFNERLSADQQAQIESVISGTGFEPVFGTPPANSVDIESDVGVVCLPIDPVEDADVQEKIKDYTMAGVRVVAIWLDDAAEEILPPGVLRLGSAAISVGSSKAREALEGEAVWETPKGKKRAEPAMQRNRC
ncbi:MAG: hypothetical protein JJ911_04235 [Rhizobiaceae bacterium]|nr:hypothetical protein [Rhizobiaceae bacterium]